MKLKKDLEAVVASPSDGLVNVWPLALDVRLASADVVSPVADRKANVVESSSWRVSRRQRRPRGKSDSPAIWAKSFSVIQVFQWFLSALSAVLRFWYWPKVHSSTMALLPVFSNR